MMDKIEFRYTKFSYGMDDYAVPVVEVFICACSSVCTARNGKEEYVVRYRRMLAECVISEGGMHLSRTRERL